jgi:copper(I)-binding protein
MKKTTALLAFAFMAACHQSPPQVVVDNAWSRATLLGQQQASVYLEVRNGGGQADRLLSVRTPRAAMAMIHSGKPVGGVARMREMYGGAAVPTDGELVLKPGGDHIMLSGLGRPLEAGEKFPLILHFKLSGDKVIAVSVLAPSATGFRHNSQ